MTLMRNSPSNECTVFALHLESLRTLFHEQGRDQCLLMINPAQFDLLEDNDFVQDQKVVVPIEHPRFDLQFAPYLVPLNLTQDQDLEIFQRSVEAAYQDWSLENLEAFAGQAVCAWVLTQAPAKEVATYWAKNTFVHRHNHLDKLLRWHDPSVREWLYLMLSPAQINQLLGPADRLCSIGRRQNLIEHAKTRDTSPHPPHLQLSETQWQAVESFALLHAAWVNAWAEDEHFKDRLPTSADIKPYVESLEAAKQLGIEGEEHLKQFLTFAWRYRPDFYRIEPYNQLVDKLLPNN